MMSNPEEYAELLDAIPDEVYQKHFGRLWDRSEFFRQLLFKSPEAPSKLESIGPSPHQLEILKEGKEVRSERIKPAGFE